MNEKELLQLKDRIDNAKTSLSESEGKKKYLMQELGEKYKCKDIEKASKLTRKMNDEVDQLNEEIAKGVKHIEEKYNV